MIRKIALAAVLMAAQPVSADVPVVHIPAADPAGPCPLRCYTPIEAVTLASQAAPKGGLAGRFAVYVKAADESRGRFFLNSETDYRDRNCLTLVLSPAAAGKLAGQANLQDVRTRFLGKWVVVEGIARRVRIDFTENGKPTGKYYYQVHVFVRDARQVLPRTSQDAPPPAVES